MNNGGDIFMNSKIVYAALPDIWASEDRIFNICMVEIPEFPRYITDFDDIVGYFPEKLISNAYRNLNIDSVRLRKNGDLITIEHHSSIDYGKLRRNFEYLTALHAASKRRVLPFIFNTDEIPKLTVDYVNFTTFYSPIWFNTREVEASVKLNNIKYKILKQQLINTYDILDLIWMPKFRCDIPIDDIILELVDIYNQIIVNEQLLDIFRKCLIMWAGKYVIDEEKKNKVIGGLNLSAMEANDLSEAIKSARIEGALLRSQQQGHKECLKEGLKEGLEQGHKEGLKEAEQKFVLKLLESFSPEEISKDFDISLERINEIKNGNKFFSNSKNF